MATYTEVGIAGTFYIGGTSSATFTLTPTAIGDLIVLTPNAYFSGTLQSISSVSGGPVNSWHKGPALSANNSDSEIWWGVATSTTGGTVTVTYSGTVTGGSGSALQFHSTGTASGQVWVIDGAGNTSSVSATSGTIASVTPAQSGEIHICVVGMNSASNLPSITTGGWTNAAIEEATYYGTAAYNVNTGSGAQAPSWTCSGTVSGATCAALFLTQPPASGGFFMFFDV